MRTVPGPAAGVERWHDVAAAPGVRAKLRYLDERQKRRLPRARLSPVLDAEGQPVREPDGTPRMRLHDDDTWLISEALVAVGVLAVEGYARADGTPILTGADLAQHGEALVISELAGELSTGLALTAAEGKASGGSSGSSPAICLNGTAEPVANGGSTFNGDAGLPHLSPTP